MGTSTFTAKEQVTVERTFEVDDRIYRDDLPSWKIADIILNGNLDRIIDNLYHESARAVEAAASQINDAFKKADAIIDLGEDKEDQ